MFERFTTSARAVVVDAQAQARRLGHRRVGTEHVLLALCAPDEPIGTLLRSFGVTTGVVDGVLAQMPLPSLDGDRVALASLGIDLDRVRAAVEANYGPGALDVEQRGDGDGIGTRVRRRRRLSPHRRRRLFGDQTCAEPERGGHIPFSPRVKKCLELSLREALRLHHNFIAPEHIALGVLREGQGLACLILANRSVPFGTLQAAVEHSLRQSA